ncbi:MAG TPA: glycoside hydrolase family 2 TIM barrel-domain containing protein [Terriglobales bacterium]|nr:glycoside hydrolase family 2 TIM barrel-domain containing protein [Terriglobales bacterium]
MMNSRREFLAGFSGMLAVTSLPVAALATTDFGIAEASGTCTERIDLNGTWRFQLDPDSSGVTRKLQESDADTSAWNSVMVPHTWQINQDSADYYGNAWYRREFEASPEWAGKIVRIEFEAVFHSATVWVNGRKAGEHLRKGYTAFAFDITPLLRYDAPNVVVVQANNLFDEAMLPRGRSSDWTHDGGMYRPVSLLVTPKVYIERVIVDSVPNLNAKTAELSISAVIHNGGTKPWRGTVAYRVEEDAVKTAVEKSQAVLTTVKPGESATIALPKGVIRDVKLWHFDHPNLYALTAEIAGKDNPEHQLTTTFGVRSIEVKEGAFYLNGERVRLMGVERMAGSNPEFGMAEPTSWIVHDHDDMKELNCIFTRVHWPQDKRVLDYCDRHGILIQTEVPTWGPNTFKDMRDKPSPEIMENGLEQLREMVAHDRNHPSIFSWGLCNEIGGQNPPAYNFAKRMLEEAKKLDPRRLCSYASNSLQSTPDKDVSALMDFIEWNEYYETWYPGTPDSVRKNLAEIAKTFPGKPIVISEYGYCACTVDRPEGDQRRIEILNDHDRVFRESAAVGGLIFFCYNDYRTHVGDKGVGVMKQRVHGVVDLFGARKESYEVLRHESSPVESIRVKGHPGSFTVSIRNRNSVPAYALIGYKLRAILYGPGEIPLERREVALPDMASGQDVSIPIMFGEKGAMRVQFDVLRPTGFSARTHVWKP